jgi:hypothetical protein
MRLAVFLRVLVVTRLLVLSRFTTLPFLLAFTPPVITRRRRADDRQMKR